MGHTGLVVVLGVIYASAIGLGNVIYRKTFRKRLYPDGLPPAVRAAKRRLSLWFLGYGVLLVAIGGGIGLLTKDWVVGIGVALGVMVFLPRVLSALAQSKRKRSANG